MRVFVWRVADLVLEAAPKPAVVMERNHNSNIFCYQFSLEFVPAHSRFTF